MWSFVDIRFQVLANDDLEEAIADIRRLLDGLRTTAEHLLNLRNVFVVKVAGLDLEAKQIASCNQQLRDGLESRPQKRRLVGLTTLETHVHHLRQFSEIVIYEPYVGKYKYRRVANALPLCPGCNKQLPIVTTLTTQTKFDVTVYLLDYIMHCLSCETYLCRGLQRNYDSCKLTFLNQRQLAIHETRTHPKNPRPSWMPANIFSRSRHSFSSQNISCPGCYQQFNVGKRSVPSLEYYVHCIKECPKYKQLDLIRECRTCKYIFLHEKSLTQHIASRHRDKSMTRPWMAQQLRRHHSMARNYDDKANCLDCGKQFPARKTISTTLPRMDFFVPCIEDCESYQQLGLIKECQQCKCKFLNQQGFFNHRCERKSRLQR